MFESTNKNLLFRPIKGFEQIPNKIIGSNKKLIEHTLSVKTGTKEKMMRVVGWVESDILNSVEKPDINRVPTY